MKKGVFVTTLERMNEGRKEGRNAIRKEGKKERRKAVADWQNLIL
jgi:hypothetical protein